MGCLRTWPWFSELPPSAPLPCSQGSLAGPAHSSASMWSHLVLALSPWQTLVPFPSSVGSGNIASITPVLFLPETSILPSFLPAPPFLHHSSFISFLAFYFFLPPLCLPFQIHSSPSSPSVTSSTRGILLNFSHLRLSTCSQSGT